MFAALIQENWYDILTSDFMRRAYIGGTLLAITGGLIGYFVVIRRLAFASHALGHLGMPGATGAVLVGLPLTLGLAVFSIAGGLAIGVLGKRAADREVATGSILAFSIGLGLAFANLVSGQSSLLTNVLFGNLLAITAQQIWVFAGFSVVLLAALAVIARPLLFASVAPEVAAARGIPVGGLGVLFVVMMALAVTMAVPFVGTLLLFALLVTPAAAALAITPRPGLASILSVVIALVSVWGGLFLSALFDLAASFFIVTIAVVIWLVATIVHRRGTTAAL
ncbi:MAG: metal ABC transporter permease [Actinomycetota bacterium]